MRGERGEPQQRTLLHEVMTVVTISSCFWGAFFGAFWWHSRQQQRRQSDERFVLQRLASRSTTQDRLPLGVLSELLGVDACSRPSLFAIDPGGACRQLLACPAISQARVWRLLPCTLGVEYALRPPAAAIAGLKNIGIDRYGTAFFLFPFYPPKRLPVLVLPMRPAKTLSEAQRSLRLSKELPIALRMLERIQQAASSRHIIVESIDVAHLGEHNVFRREVVVVLSSLLAKEKHLYVRIGSKMILPALNLFPSLCDRLMREGFRSGMIDLRYERMAIVSGEIAQNERGGS